MEIVVGTAKPMVDMEKGEAKEGSKADSAEGYSDSELESALSCLQEAEKVRGDADLMAALKPYIDSKKADLDKVSGIELLKQKAEKRVKQLDYEEEALKRKRGE